MPAIGLSESEYNRVFGPKDDLDDNGPGRSRKCKTCGSWHRLDKPWPHNCRPEAPRRNYDLSAPLLAPKFEAFTTGLTETAEYIGSRDDKREFMKRNDLVEYDEGVQPEREMTEREIMADIVQDIKRFEQTDPLNIPPDLKATERVGDASNPDTPEIKTDSIEVIK